MKICIVAPSLRMGGVERASSTLANRFVSEGHQVHFLPIITHEHFFALDQAIQISEPNFNARSLRVWRTIRWLRKVICQSKPDIVLAFNNIYGALAVAALAGTRYKVCVSDRSSPFFKWPWKLDYFTRLIFFFRPPDAVISQTSIAAEFTRKRIRGRYKQTVIPNPLRAPKLHETSRKKIILAVGRLSDYLKGFDRLVVAFSKVDALGWRLVFAGGDDNEQLKALAQQHGVSHNIDYLGAVKDMDKVYSEAGIFVIPSRSEGFPNALCEAMAAGIPCISFDFVAGPSDIITNGVDGILVENGNIDSMADQIQRLITSNDLRKKLGENAKNIRSRLNENVVGQQFLDFLSSVASKP
jgi:GalNAc-alpha-(1->4)-GalNAc-alpha-(1->3)-diNAcBac-PP-undecaprenol alpha-1,4-N-acetyl-D-galactosaminyltransferase